MGLDCGWLSHLMQPSHWSASDWLSESVLIACCALLVEEILNTGERSPRMYSTDIGVESRREEAREWRLRYGDGTEAGERETDTSFTQGLSIVISLIRELISCHIPARNGITLSLGPRGADCVMITRGASVSDQSEPSIGVY